MTNIIAGDNAAVTKQALSSTKTFIRRRGGDAVFTVVPHNLMRRVSTSVQLLLKVRVNNVIRHALSTVLGVGEF